MACAGGVADAASVRLQLPAAFDQPVLRCVGGAVVACADNGFAQVYASVAGVASLSAVMRRLTNNTMVVGW